MLTLLILIMKGQMSQNLIKSRYSLFIHDLLKVIQLIFRRQFQDHDFEQLALESIEVLEHQIVIYLALRLGFDQSIDKVTKMKQKVDFGNWLIRSVFLMSISRAIVVLNVDGETAIYFGDPLFASKDRDVLVIVVIVGVIIMFIAHETAVLIEKRCGFVGEPARIKVLLKNGFSHFPFVKPLQKDFCRSFYLISAFHNIGIQLTIPYVSLLYNYELCVNLYNHFSLKTLLFEIVWTLTLTPLVAYLGVQLLSYGAIFCIQAGVFYFHMESLSNATFLLVESIDKVDNKEVKFIMQHTLVLFNEMDSYSRKVRFLLFYLYTGVALQPLWFIHFGIIVGNHSVVMDTLIAGLGIVIILYILILGLVCVKLTNTVRSFYPMWHQIYSGSKATTVMKLKVDFN